MHLRQKKIKLDNMLVTSKLKGKFIFVTEHKQMCQYVGTHWEAVTDIEFMLEIEALLLKNTDEYFGSITASNIVAIVSGHATRSKLYLKAQPQLFKFPTGKNFNNSYLVFETHKLLPHSQSRFVTSVSNQNYNKDEVMTAYTKKFFYDSVGGETHKINAVRTSGYPVLIQCGQYHASYYFSGPRSSGKSTLLNIFHYIIGPNAKSCELVDLDNLFNRGEIVSCNLVIVNEFSMTYSKHEKQIKAFSGRDLISSTKKKCPRSFYRKVPRYYYYNIKHWTRHSL